MDTSLKNMSVRRAHAFTLIELLTVIAVIGVLTSILFAVIGAAKKSALSATCATRLHQVGLAILLYSNDHRGTLPVHIWDNVHTTVGDKPNTLATNLAPYLTSVGTKDPSTGKEQANIQELICPLFEKVSPPNSSVTSYYVFQGNVLPDNVFPGGVLPEPPGAGEKKPTYFDLDRNANSDSRIAAKLISIDKPARTIAIQDNPWFDASRQFTAHGKSCNVLFFDGHVATKKFPF